MTRQDYERIAHGIHYGVDAQGMSIRVIEDILARRYPQNDAQSLLAKYTTICAVTAHLATDLALDNQRFDVERFMTAALGQPWIQCLPEGEMNLLRRYFKERVEED
jgi:hypothetical protein